LAAVDAGGTAVDAGPDLGGTFDAAPTVTMDVIFSIVLFGTPALARSATDA
jgi:hypothetical protein